MRRLYRPGPGPRARWHPLTPGVICSGPVTHRSFLVAGIILTGMLMGTGDAASPATAAPVFKPCRLDHPAGLTSVEAQCTQVVVPEDPAAPGGRQLTLFVARIPALSRQAAPEPLFILAGGPGLSASTFYASTAPLFARARRRHDLIQYTTSVAVRDLDAVRRALGYGRISLYGSSYGTRVAQHYARRYPASTL